MFSKLKSVFSNKSSSVANPKIAEAEQDDSVVPFDSREGESKQSSSVVVQAKEDTSRQLTGKNGTQTESSYFTSDASEN